MSELLTEAESVVLVGVVRDLYDALMDARVYVAAEAVLANSGLGAPGNRAQALLEQVDGALADAGELLDRGSVSDAAS